MVVPSDTQQNAVVTQNNNDVVTNGTATNETATVQVYACPEGTTPADGWTAKEEEGSKWIEKQFNVGTPFASIASDFSNCKLPVSCKYLGLSGGMLDTTNLLAEGGWYTRCNYVDTSETFTITVVDSSDLTTPVKGASVTAKVQGSYYDDLYSVTAVSDDKGIALFNFGYYGQIMCDVTCENYYPVSSQVEHGRMIALQANNYKNSALFVPKGNANGFFLDGLNQEKLVWANYNSVFSNSDDVKVCILTMTLEDVSLDLLYAYKNDSSDGIMFAPESSASCLPTGAKYFLKQSDGSLTQFTSDYTTENPLTVSGNMEIYCFIANNNNSSIYCEASDGVTFTFEKKIGDDVVAHKTSDSLNANLYKGCELSVEDNVITATGTTNDVSAQGVATITANVPDGKKFEAFVINGEEVTSDSNATLDANDVAFLTVKTSDIVNPTPDPTPTPDGDTSAATSSSSSKTGDMTIYAVLGMLSVIALSSCGVAVSRKIKFNK